MAWPNDPWPTGINPVVCNPTTVQQAYAATAEVLSGVTQLSLMMGKFNFAWLTCETAALRYRWDGVAPTGTTGHVLPVNTPLKIVGMKRLYQFSLIGDAGAAGTLEFTLDNTANAGGLV
jgi:hypothetical protein